MYSRDDSRQLIIAGFNGWHSHGWGGDDWFWHHHGFDGWGWHPWGGWHHHGWDWD